MSVDLGGVELTLVSDLHREFKKDTKSLLASMQFDNLPKTKICVLAGDIGHPVLRKTSSGEYSCNPSFVHILKKFRERYPTVLFVSGNHEYYQAKSLGLKNQDALTKIDQVIQKACDKAKVIHLNCSTWIDPDSKIEFIGCTLWSLMSHRTFLQMNDKNVFSDVDELLTQHVRHVKWLSSVLEIKDLESKHPRVVITHYLPSFQMVHPKFALSTLNDGFCSKLDHLLTTKNAKAWLCGHTHEYIKKEIGGVQVVCNPLGYPGEKRDSEFLLNPVKILL
jgi:Icc-related predicted phosphoesterase